ncbi:DUF1642 domain-containing protein [Streptococcus rubneri]|uniref:DUF1642 domain-containing protein n=1 Tax=Streptococcus rubneri TaxID=1234680 RepID=UPI00321AEA04
MNKDKVYLGGCVVGHAADTLGYKGLQIQLENMDIVEIDENLVHKGINEPQKVMIPQFVADFIAEQKKLGHTLSYSIDASMSDGVAEWYWDNSELFARAWLDGYEIEKEKRYLVKIKGVVSSYLNYDIVNDWWFLNKKHNGFTVRTHHTQKELEEAGFGEVFDSPLFEVEEVME